MVASSTQLKLIGLIFFFFKSHQVSNWIMYCSDGYEISNFLLFRFDEFVFKVLTVSLLTFGLLLVVITKVYANQRLETKSRS